VLFKTSRLTPLSSSAGKYFYPRHTVIPRTPITARSRCRSMAKVYRGTTLHHVLCKRFQKSHDRLIRRTTPKFSVQRVCLPLRQSLLLTLGQAQCSIFGIQLNNGCCFINSGWCCMKYLMSITDAESQQLHALATSKTKQRFMTSVHRVHSSDWLAPVMKLTALTACKRSSAMHKQYICWCIYRTRTNVSRFNN